MLRSLASFNILTRLFHMLVFSPADTASLAEVVAGVDRSKFWAAMRANVFIVAAGAVCCACVFEVASPTPDVLMFVSAVLFGLLCVALVSDGSFWFSKLAFAFLVGVVVLALFSSSVATSAVVVCAAFFCVGADILFYQGSRASVYAAVMSARSPADVPYRVVADVDGASLVEAKSLGCEVFLGSLSGVSADDRGRAKMFMREFLKADADEDVLYRIADSVEDFQVSSRLYLAVQSMSHVNKLRETVLDPGPVVGFGHVTM